MNAETNNFATGKTVTRTVERDGKQYEMQLIEKVRMTYTPQRVRRIDAGGGVESLPDGNYVVLIGPADVHGVYLGPYPTAEARDREAVLYLEPGQDLGWAESFGGVLVAGNYLPA